MSSSEIDLQQLQKMAQVNRKVIHRLRERIEILESALELVCDDTEMAWLYKNRSERMDATLPLFPKARASFHLARYEFAAKYVHDKSIADIACGTGYGVALLCNQGGAKDVIGIDCCAEAIAYAKNRHCPPGCQFQVADATRTGLPDHSLDLITSFETLEHVADAGALLQEFARILKPGGRLICSTPNQWPLEIAPHHVEVYDKPLFEKTLNQHFDIEEMLNQNSGSDFKYNHQQPAGFVPTTSDNESLAECFVAVARPR